MTRMILIVFAIALVLGSLPATPRTLTQDSTTPAASPAAAPAAELHYSNKWRLQVSEGANNDGVMLFRLTPMDGTPIEIPVPLEGGRGEDGCARDIRDAFQAALDGKVYKVEVDDEEDVLVKRRKGPDFSIELVESTVRGTRVNFDRE